MPMHILRQQQMEETYAQEQQEREAAEKEKEASKSSWKLW